MAKRPGQRGWMVAACAMAVATAVGTSAPSRDGETQALHQIERYCTTSWRNAGIQEQDWEDCTQQALVELLDSMPPAELQVAIEQPESEPRRELNRAVWRLVQRNRRQVKVNSLEAVQVESPAARDWREEWRAVELAARDLLTPRQQQILQLTRDGWRVGEIAEKLSSTAERISDEKYKAIARLRTRFDRETAPAPLAAATS